MFVLKKINAVYQQEIVEFRFRESYQKDSLINDCRTIRIYLNFFRNQVTISLPCKYAIGRKEILHTLLLYVTLFTMSTV